MFGLAPSLLAAGILAAIGGPEEGPQFIASCLASNRDFTVTFEAMRPILDLDKFMQDKAYLVG